jgi:hypothetical protein
MLSGADVSEHVKAYTFCITPEVRVIALMSGRPAGQRVT